MVSHADSHSWRGFNARGYLKVISCQTMTKLPLLTIWYIMIQILYLMLHVFHLTETTWQPYGVKYYYYCHFVDEKTQA